MRAVLVVTLAGCGAELGDGAGGDRAGLIDADITITDATAPDAMIDAKDCVICPCAPPPDDSGVYGYICQR